MLWQALVEDANGKIGVLDTVVIEAGDYDKAMKGAAKALSIPCDHPKWAVPHGPLRLNSVIVLEFEHFDEFSLKCL